MRWCLSALPLLSAVREPLWLAGGCLMRSAGQKHLLEALYHLWLSINLGRCSPGVAGYSTYAPSKAALRSLADTLRNEVCRGMSGLSTYMVVVLQYA